jgi:manganese transport protein
MATDIAEVIGGAVALWLLFGVPLPIGGLLTGAVSIALLLIQQRRGARVFEFVVIGLLVIITIGFTYGCSSPRRMPRVAAGLCPASTVRTPCCSPPRSSARRSCRTRSTRTPPSPATGSRPRARPDDRGVGVARLLRATLGRHDRPGDRGHREPRDPAARRPTSPASPAPTASRAHAALAAASAASSRLFAVGLLASGLASTAVGAYAGAEIMHGLLRVRIPLLARRLVTLVPPSRSSPPASIRPGRSSSARWC